MYRYKNFGVEEMIINSMNYTNNPYLQESSKGTNLLKHKRGVIKNSTCESGLGTRDKNEVINSGNFADKSEVAAINFKGAGFDKILASDKFANFLEYANAHNQTTNALVALVTAGMIRPTLTMAIPGMKDKKDKTYSAAQAVSTGFLGFGVTMALTKPLDDAFKKVSENPEKYNCKFLVDMKKKIKDLETAATSASGQELKNINKQKKTLGTLIKNIPEWAICVPRAMLTIALIPIILKYVFGLEKKPKHKPTEEIKQQPQNNFENLKQGKDIKTFLTSDTTKTNNAEKVNFSGSIPVDVATNYGAKKAGGLYDKFTDLIAKGITAPLINWKGLQEAADKLKNSDSLFTHLSVITSFVISSVYMQRTLSNDNLEEDKKKVLAVNQGLTFLISAVSTYTVDDKLEDWWQRVTAKFIGSRAQDKDFAKDFKAAQSERLAKMKTDKKLKSLKALDYAKSKKMVLPTNIDALVGGMGLLKKMVVIGSIFRLAVPVLVTPLASVLSEKYLEHKRSKDKDNA